ncbi:MAG: sigma-70 family RNA polymerase sigma factor [Clostridia bacterium]|nr:sigma-70 family RNA polymerase sigma factor [Clostridia bacterium]
MFRNRKINNEERFIENISESYKEFAEYKLVKKFYIVWILNDTQKWEEEVTAEKYLQAVCERKENNNNPLCVPYYTTRRFYAKTKDMEDYIEIPRKVFHLIKEWQTTDLNHYFYITRRYRETKMDEFIETLPSEDNNPEQMLINQEKTEKFENFIENNLTEAQKNIFNKIVFDNKTQSEIARELNVSRQAIFENLKYIRKKIKNFYNIP